ncbi:AAA family ATPase [Endozoicomonas sp. 4G]|uniref:AAA family ATPase n=1 Tax=Endozoicomonas sp. 4G TaxID=2872754 RepID=UPI00207902CF|nr:AAA family ATPase [Endozoicomonas sp. 4G]
MRIEWLKVENFRGIRKLRLDFNLNSNVQVLVGVNGVGKSALLECLAIMLSTFTERVKGDPRKARQFTDDDISCGENWLQAHIGVHHPGDFLAWGVVKNRTGAGKSGQKSELDNLNDLTKSLLEQLQNKEPVNLPLAVYYNVRRAVVEPPMRVHDSLEYKPTDAYWQALDNTSSEFDSFFKWFRRQEDLENELRRDNVRYRDPLLETVRNAISEFMEGFDNLRIRRRPLRMTVNKDGVELNIKQLSDGEKCLLALVGDLARRLAIANPTLENKLDGDGVVLIDEVDLHLHPRWQRMVIEQLTKTFKRCQFILSTHSPQVLGHLEPENIWVLRRDEKGEVEAVHPLVPTLCVGVHTSPNKLMKPGLTSVSFQLATMLKHRSVS